MKITTTNFTDNLKVEKNSYNFVSLKKAEKKLNFILEKLPFSYKILLENLIRNIDNTGVKRSDLENLIKRKAGKEILFSPTRVLMQDYTGVPAIADLAAMRDKMLKDGKNPEIINPVVPVSLVIDHSISVDNFSIKLSN